MFQYPRTDSFVPYDVTKGRPTTVDKFNKYLEQYDVIVRRMRTVNYNITPEDDRELNDIVNKLVTIRYPKFPQAKPVEIIPYQILTAQPSVHDNDDMLRREFKYFLIQSAYKNQ